jgi:hypothetical protein
MDAQQKIKWAPRVERRKIARLYEKLALGIFDDELIDDVGCSFYARCQSIIDVTEAQNYGRVRCQNCGEIIQACTHEDTEQLTCKNCEWTVTWGEFFKSYHRKQLTGGQGYRFFTEFVEQYPRRTSSRDKVLLIDKIIHECHSEIGNVGGRPIACNLIEGKMSYLIRFLNNLPLAPDPKMRDSFIRWRKAMLGASE